MKKTLSNAALILASLTSGAVFANAVPTDATPNAVTAAITASIAGLSDVLSIIAVVAPVGIAIAIAFKVYGKGKSAVNKA